MIFTSIVFPSKNSPASASKPKSSLIVPEVGAVLETYSSLSALLLRHLCALKRACGYDRTQHFLPQRKKRWYGVRHQAPIGGRSNESGEIGRERHPAYRQTFPQRRKYRHQRPSGAKRGRGLRFAYQYAYWYGD